MDGCTIVIQSRHIESPMHSGQNCWILYHFPNKSRLSILLDFCPLCGCLVIQYTVNDFVFEQKNLSYLVGNKKFDYD